MEKEQNRQWCSMTPLVCSIVPFGFAGGLLWFVDRADPHILRPGNWGCFGGLLYGWALPCFGLLIAILMVPLGIYSVLSGVSIIKEPETRGKMFIVLAIVFGILDIVIGSGYLLWTFSKVF